MNYWSKYPKKFLVQIHRENPGGNLRRNSPEGISRENPLRNSEEIPGRSPWINSWSIWSEDFLKEILGEIAFKNLLREFLTKIKPEKL